MRILLLIFITSFLYKTEAQTSVLNTADSLYLNGNFSKAIAVYKNYELQDEVYDNIAKSYVAIGNYDEALRFYDLCIKSNPENALAKYEYARLLSKTKKYSESLKVFDLLMLVDYGNPNYHYEMGLVLEKLNDSTAMNRFRTAYDLDHTHQKAIFKIAKQYLKKGMHAKSHDYIDTGLSSYQNNVELISLKAQNYYHQEYFENAKQWFLKLIELGESSEFIHEKLSIVYAELSEYSNAITQRKLALKYNAFDANSLFVLGTYYERLNDFVNAEKYILKALKIKDVALDFEYQKLGMVLNRQSRYPEAIAAFKKSLKEDPSNTSSAFFIVTTKDYYYEDLNAKIEAYKQFVDAYPKSPFLSFAQSRLKELEQEKFLKSKE